MKENLIQQKSFDFALRMVQLYRELVKGSEFILSKQVLRSGTSIGANVAEAQAAQSKADFISKMSIASKEARETCYWLRLLRDSKTLEKCAVDPLLYEAEAIVNILTSIVKTSAKNK
jgi:four helix bundle protein